MMSPIQQEVLNNLLDELDIKKEFWHNVKTVGIKWHGGSPSQYLKFVTPTIAVISAFPVEYQNTIPVETFDLLNYKWIALCYSNGWASETLSQFSASLFCDAIDVYYGIGKYNNKRWPSLDYNNLITTTTILDSAIKQNVWDGLLTAENWKDIHDLCIEGISRREKKLAEAEEDFKRRRSEILQASLSVLSKEDEAKDNTETIDISKREEVYNVADEEEAKRIQIEEEAKKEASLYEEKRKQTEFAVRKQALLSENKKEIEDIRREIASIAKKITNTNANKQTDLCKEQIERLVEVFMALKESEAWRVELSNRQYGESLEKEHPNGGSTDIANNDEVDIYRNKMLPDEASYTVTDRVNLYFSTQISAKIIKKKMLFCSIISKGNNCYIKFYSTIPEGVEKYARINPNGGKNIRSSSSQVLIDIYHTMKLSGKHFFLKVREAPEMGDMVYQFVSSISRDGHQ